MCLQFKSPAAICRELVLKTASRSAAVSGFCGDFYSGVIWTLQLCISRDPVVDSMYVVLCDCSSVNLIVFFSTIAVPPAGPLLLSFR